MRKKTNLIGATVKKKADSVLVAAMLCLLGTNVLYAQPAPRLGISPDRYQVEFDQRGGETQSLLIQNLSDEPMTVNVSVGTWDLDDNNQIRLIPPSEASLDQWIIVNPVRITIPAQSPQTIRWTIMPRLKPEDGEYRAILFVEEDVSESADSGSLRMKMRYGLPIYGHVGERKLSAEFFGIRVDRDNNRIFLDLASTGNTHGRMSGFYGVWPATKFPGSKEALAQLRRAAGRNNESDMVTYGAMPGAVILPGNRRQLPLSVNIQQPGDYVVQFDAEFAGLEITDTVELTIPGT